VATFFVGEVVDVIGHGGSQFDSCRPLAGVKWLDLHPRTERLHGGVVEAVAHGAERAEQAPSPRVLLKAPGRKLRAMVGMQKRILRHVRSALRPVTDNVDDVHEFVEAAEVVDVTGVEPG
jgi:hypothetical protein